MAWKLSLTYKDMTFWEHEIETDDEVVAWWTIHSALDQTLPVLKHAENPAIAKFFKRVQPGDVEQKIERISDRQLGNELVLVH